jgi:D-alanine-D-alanine ligase
MGSIVTLKQQNNPTPDAFGKVAVLMGGWSAERAISLKSGKAVLAALQQRGVNAHGIDVQRDTVLQQLEAGHFDRAFIILHGPGGEDGVIQGALEILGVPYTGSGVMASALAMDKLRSKRLLEGSNLPTPKYMLLDQETDLNYVVAELGLPLMVKPALEGSSIGMSKVEDESQMQAAYQLAAQFAGAVFAEQWITGKEYTVAILGEEALPIIRLETPHKFYDYDAKYFANDTKYHCPCGLAAQEESQLQRLALSAFKAIGAQGWGRVDILCDQTGRPFIIELNTIPGMTDHSLVPMAARVRGIEFDELVYRILAQTLVTDKPNSAEAGHGNTR